ncbi:hypothetical protein GE300_17530 [Rhodobacteraceae bacterium 2CG4]|uniref:Histidine kinase n=1 Tax=Halovulum marinum TaxID=2662447 RepID=A0A6L5Z5R0_9RHOB|nr:hypothetical protein [Halovulum marinum]MSU91384.1 hypothetical protein [Halovulum marinum]
MTRSISNPRRRGPPPAAAPAQAATVLRPAAAGAPRGERDAEASMRAEIGAAVRVIRNLPRLMRDDLSTAPPHVRTAAEASLDAFAAQADRIESALRRHGDLSALEAAPGTPEPDAAAAIGHIAAMRGLATGRRVAVDATIPALRLDRALLSAAVNALIDAGLDATRASPGSALTLRVLTRRDRVRLSVLHDVAPPAEPDRAALFTGPHAGPAMVHLWQLAARTGALLELGPGPGGGGTRITLELPDRAG